MRVTKRLSPMQKIIYSETFTFCVINVEISSDLYRLLQCTMSTFTMKQFSQNETVLGLFQADMSVLEQFFCRISMSSD